MSMLLDAILETESRNGGAGIVSENNNLQSIDWRAGMSDPAEMMRLARGASESVGIQAGLKRAGLNVRGGRVAMFSALVPPWHKLGKVISQAATSAEALQLAELSGWNLQKLEQYVDFQDRRISTGAYAIVRGDTGQVLTQGKSVGDRFQILSNEASFAFLDAVIDGRETRYETAGAMGNGERVWILAKMPGATVEVAGGDSLESYILFGNGHDGSQAMFACQTSQRVVCQNTYRNAMRARAGKGICIRHTTNIKAKVEAARRALGLAKQQAEQFADTARTLAAQPMPDPQAFFSLCLDDVVDVTIAEKQVTGASIKDSSVLDAILDISDVTERQSSVERLDKAKERRAELLDTILETYENGRNNGMPSISGTAWAAVNAVSETVQHGTALRYKGTDRERAENRFDSILDGRAQEVTQAAVGYALAMAN